MRLIVAVCLAFAPIASGAQTITDPSLARVLPNADAVAATTQTLEATRGSTLVTGATKSTAPISRNEQYNLSRAASGRVGVRLGNDESFTVGQRVP